MPASELPPISSLRPDFIWGVSTSSFQIEGAAREDGKGPSVWDTYCQTGLVKNRDTGDVACDHYHRYREDVGLMKSLGVQAYRFSVSWPRVLPAGRGAVNEPGLAFYDRLIDELLASGIEPWLCLYHWDLPQALEEHGGWLKRESADWFAEYAALIAARFGDRVRRFATFNEPSMFSLFSRSLGKRDRSSEDALHGMIHHVNLAHGAAVDVLREKVRHASIGCIHSYQPCRPSGASPADAEAAMRLGFYWNNAFPDVQCRGDYPPPIRSAVERHIQPGDLARICRPLDWFGLNHYSPVYVKAHPTSMLRYDFGDKPAGTPLTPVERFSRKARLEVVLKREDALTAAQLDVVLFQLHGALGRERPAFASALAAMRRTLKPEGRLGVLGPRLDGDAWIGPREAAQLGDEAGFRSRLADGIVERQWLLVLEPERGGAVGPKTGPAEGRPRP